jgi:hypothetical protein
MKNMNFKNLLFFFLTVLVFTQGFIFLHESKFEKGEFDRICNSIYTEKVWIDTCYLPYNTEIGTFTFVRNVSIAGAAVSLLLFLKKKNK